MSWLPNIITSVRILLAPITGFLIFLALGEESGSRKEFLLLIALGLYVAAALTDWLDGWLARRLNAHSPLGAKLDLWADKLLVFCLLAGALLYFPIFAVVTLLCLTVRDLFIMVLRARRPDVQLGASQLAKLKTALVMGAIGLMIFAAWSDISLLLQIGSGVLLIGCILSLYTGWKYASLAFKPLRNERTGR